MCNTPPYMIGGCAAFCGDCAGVHLWTNTRPYRIGRYALLRKEE